MSTQINQFLIWGIQMPYEWHRQWEKDRAMGEDGFYEHFSDFMDDSAFDSKIKHKDGIFCLFDGRDGRYIIIGRVMAKSKDGDLLGENPIAMTLLSELEQELIRNSVERNFSVTGDFKLWLVAHYR